MEHTVNYIVDLVIVEARAEGRDDEVRLEAGRLLGVLHPLTIIGLKINILVNEHIYLSILFVISIYLNIFPVKYIYQ